MFLWNHFINIIHNFLSFIILEPDYTLTLGYDLITHPDLYPNTPIMIIMDSDMVATDYGLVLSWDLHIPATFDLTSSFEVYFLVFQEPSPNTYEVVYSMPLNVSLLEHGTLSQKVT